MGSDRALFCCFKTVFYFPFVTFGIVVCCYYPGCRFYKGSVRLSNKNHKHLPDMSLNPLHATLFPALFLVQLFSPLHYCLSSTADWQNEFALQKVPNRHSLLRG